MKDLISNRQQSLLILLTPIVVFWLLLLAWGYPSPHMDDLAFIGTPINLNNGGEFVNPWLASWHERVGDRFYIQPPFHQFLLTGWLFLSGVSTKSFLAFQCFWYIVASVFLALLLRKYHISIPIIWLIIILYAIAMAELGLRSEAVGIAWGITGLYLLSNDTRWHSWGGFTCLGISILSYVTIFVYLIPLTAFMIGDRLFKLPISQRWQYLRDRVFCLIGAIAVVSLLFLLAIDFEISRFFSDLIWHSQIRRGSILENLITIKNQSFSRYGILTYSLLYGLYLSIFILTIWQRRKVGNRAFFFVILLTCSFIINALLYVTSVYQGIFHFVMSLGILLLIPEIQLPQIFKKILWSLALIILLIHNNTNILSTVNYLSSRKPEYTSIQNYVTQHPELTYIIDDYAARLVFDYQLPPKTISWTFANKAPDFWLVSQEQIPENTVMIASLFRANYLETFGEIPGLPDWPHLKIGGYELSYIPSYPQEVVIVPSIQE